MPPLEVPPLETLAEPPVPDAPTDEPAALAPDVVAARGPDVEPW
jgi:hypothetical protein